MLVLSAVNLELASELAVANEELKKQDIETKELVSKFSRLRLSVRNTNKGVELKIVLNKLS